MSCRLLAALATIGAVSAVKPAPAPYVDTVETPFFDMIVVLCTKVHDLIDKIPIASSLQKFGITVKAWVEKYVIVDDIADAIKITKTAAAVLLTIVTLLTVLNGLALLVNAVKDYLEGFLAFPTMVRACRFSASPPALYPKPPACAIVLNISLSLFTTRRAAGCARPAGCVTDPLHEVQDAARIVHQRRSH